MSVSGFALRDNGTCPDNHVDCGKTVTPFHACCPESTFCPPSYNADCCPTADNCTTALIRDPHCASDSWDLYDNGGYFCCKKGFVGYAVPGNSDGCASPGYAFKDGERLLPIVSSAKAESSTAAASTSATHSSTHSSADPDPTSSPTNSSTESEGGGQSNGPIIGGVVGGVVVLVLAAASLFLLWKRSKRRNAGPAEMDGKGWTPGAQPVAVGGGLPELQGDKYIAPAQLAERNEYNELPA